MEPGLSPDDDPELLNVVTLISQVSLETNL